MIINEDVSTSHETNQFDIAVAADEKEEDLEVAFSESDASQSQEDIQLQLDESDKSEIDFSVVATEETEHSETSGIKMSINQESEDADVVIGVREVSEISERTTIEGKAIYYANLILFSELTVL